MLQLRPSLAFRPANEADAGECGRICYEEFRTLNERHGFPSVFASAEAATRRVAAMIRDPAIFAVIAESADQILGFSFLRESDPIRAVGPIVVDSAVQGRGIGRKLMEAALERADGARGIRLLQEAYNMQSLSLYASLGFDARELFAVLHGGVHDARPQPGWEIKPLSQADLPQCVSLHEGVHGYSRTNELREAIAARTPLAALKRGRVCAYLTAPTNWLANHGVAETDEDMKALLTAATRMVSQSLSFLLPVRRAALFRWCLERGFRASRPMTLMTIGEYREPEAPYCPSVSY
jgi:GNAT superfamily N-acetyltransferase